MSKNKKIILEEKFQNENNKQRKIKFNEIFIKIIKKEEFKKVI